MTHITSWPIHLNNEECIPQPEEEERRFWRHLFSCDKCRRKLPTKTTVERKIVLLPEFWEEVEKYLDGFHPVEKQFFEDMRATVKLPLAWAQLHLSGLWEVPEEDTSGYNYPSSSSSIVGLGRSVFHLAPN